MTQNIDYHSKREKWGTVRNYGTKQDWNPGDRHQNPGAPHPMSGTLVPKGLDDSSSFVACDIHLALGLVLFSVRGCS